MKQNSKLLYGAQFFVIFALLLLVGLQMSNVVDYGDTRLLFYGLLLIQIVLASIKLVILKQSDDSNKKLEPVVLRRLIWLNVGLTIIALGVLFVSLYNGN